MRTRGAGPLQNLTMDDILTRRVSARTNMVSSSGAAELGANVSLQDGEVVENLQPPSEALAGQENLGVAGGRMERRNSASQLVHQRHMPTEPKKFHIPRKTKEKRGSCLSFSTNTSQNNIIETVQRF